MKFTLLIWRQKNASASGEMVRYPIDDVSPDMSFLGNDGLSQRDAHRAR